MLSNYKSLLTIVIVLFSFFILSVSCKKDKTRYEVKYTSTSASSSSTWYSDKAQAAISKDTLYITGNKDNKSSITIIVSNSAPGDYTISLTNVQALVLINKDGTKNTGTNFLSSEGVVSILKKDEKKKTVSGTFSIKAISTSLLQQEKIEGEFTVKYTSY